ncbi:MAG: cyclic nucleotide-binding domain-containing protein [Chitinivibrionales bacterium]|nr:cyclic nucleotide-binding domain-containing protein [Chitinivibrionales bacterium]
MMQPKTKNIKAGTILFHENDHSRELYIIQSGRLKVFRMICGKSVALAVLEKGAVLGEMALIDGKPRSASVKAIEDSSVIVIDADTLYKKIAGVPSWFMSIIRMTSMKIRKANSRLQRLYGSNLGANIILCLNYLFMHEGESVEGNTRCRLDLDHARMKLICLLGSTYQRVSKMLEFLQEKKMVDISDGALVQLDPTEMARYCAFLRLLVRKSFESVGVLSDAAERLVGALYETTGSREGAGEKSTELSGDTVWSVVAGAGLQDQCFEIIKELKETGLLAFRKDKEAEESENKLAAYTFTANHLLLERYYLLFRFQDMVPML